jgi:S1-C subfamily serine protease
VVYNTSKTARRDFFSFDVTEIPQGTGTGFVWDADGHIITNFHVIQGASSAQVTLQDQSHWPAELVGVEPDKDVAVLRIQAPKAQLKPIALGTSSDLAVGQDVFAIGNPFGLDQTLTTGIISALGREIKSVTGRPIVGVIQTDATINPGNSGGPLLDSAGRLIGMNTAIYSPTGASVGIGFAVPADIVNRIVEQLIRYGRVVHPSLGVEVAEDYINQQLNLKGVLILSVAQGSSADKAGVRPTVRDRFGHVKLGDIIVSIDGKTVRSTDDLYKAIDQKQVGDKVSLQMMRNGARESVTFALGKE